MSEDKLPWPLVNATDDSYGINSMLPVYLVQKDQAEALYTAAKMILEFTEILHEGEISEISVNPEKIIEAIALLKKGIEG